MQNRVLQLPRWIKQVIVVIADIFISLIATWAAFSLRLDNVGLPQSYQWHIYLMAPLLAFPIFIWFGLYRAVFRYAGMLAMLAIAKATVVYCFIFFNLLLILKFPNIPRSVGLLQPLLLLVMVGGSRGFARFWLTQMTRGFSPEDKPSLIIYGAGRAGVQIADLLLQQQKLSLIGFVDDDVNLRGKTINGHHVHGPDDLPHLIGKYNITDILLAMPTVSRVRRNEILAALRKYHIRVRSLPNIADIAQGKITVSDIRELDITDLLARDPVAPDPELLQVNIHNKTVLVTGAGGSIGSELCRQILLIGPAKLLLVEHSEYSLYQIHQELLARQAESVNVSTEIVPLLASVRDCRRVAEICSGWRPDTIYHAAAYKHVPLVEQNPSEGIRNNVLGTYNMACAAMVAGVSNFVLISTDKAVRPTNVMGASKRLAEMILQALALESSLTFMNAPEVLGRIERRTKFSMVRFGNVLGSSGSVVPLFRKQIQEGRAITLTDSEVTRYFMTIPEAAQLVLQAGAMGEGGDVFVLDMGMPVKIIDLARRIVELSGLTVKDCDNPDGDIEIKVTGLRPGEKLYEELLIGENPQPTAHSRIMKAREVFVPWADLDRELFQIFSATSCNDVVTIKNILNRLVIGYVASKELQDLGAPEREEIEVPVDQWVVSSI